MPRLALLPIVLSLALSLAPPARAESPPVPQTEVDGPVLEFDFPAVHVGVAEYAEGPTGATVFCFPDGVMAAVDVSGGAPGTTMTESLTLGYESRWVDAISFAGGSSYGLAAASGAAMELRDRRGPGRWRGVESVPGAIIYDIGARRLSTVTPDEALGRAAVRAAVPGRFPLGAAGAGRFAMIGGYFGQRQHSGQGGAFRQIGPTKIAVFTVVNALGTVVDREGRVVRTSPDPAAETRPAIGDFLAQALAESAGTTRPATRPATAPAGEGNTTLTLVVTNQRLDFWALQRLAVQVHASMARGIQPFQTQQDGDVLFAVSTREVANEDLAPDDLGVIASELAWDAVLASLPELPELDRERVDVDPAAYDRHVGDYELGPQAVLRVTRRGDGLFVEAAGKRAIGDFAAGEPAEVFPTSDAHFFADNAARDHLRFTTDDAGQTTGVILNPGPWAQRGHKVR